MRKNAIIAVTRGARARRVGRLRVEPLGDRGPSCRRWSRKFTGDSEHRIDRVPVMRARWPRIAEWLDDRRRPTPRSPARAFTADDRFSLRMAIAPVAWIAPDLC